jgi:hypothetical protein
MQRSRGASNEQGARDQASPPPPSNVFGPSIDERGFFWRGRVLRVLGELAKERDRAPEGVKVGDHTTICVASFVTIT